MNRIIKNDVTEILKDMEHTNTITFALNPIEQVEIDGEKFFARGFSCYSTEVILDGEEVCLNPLCYDGDLPTIKTKETWAFFNFEKIEWNGRLNLKCPTILLWLSHTVH